MLEEKKYIRFDWAMKRLLRQKTNFVILEGLLTTLLGRNIHIQKMLESEGNQEKRDSKYNRVDILAEDDKGELMLIEVQNANEISYFQRMIFGVSKLITDYMERGNDYAKVRKVYSINIVYFPLGVGEDSVYHGFTEFRGLHKNDVLGLSEYQKTKFDVEKIADICPEYYILRVNDFDRWSVNSLDQWLYFLSTGTIPQSASAPGLPEARQTLEVDNMSKEDRAAYYGHLDDVVILRDTIVNTRAEALQKGVAIGEKKGKIEAIKEMASFMKKAGHARRHHCTWHGSDAKTDR